MKNVHTPDRWLIIRIIRNDDTLYKVFASWYGGYLGANSWRFNSGITKARKKGDVWYFEGESGSIYQCHKNCYGAHSYGQGVLQKIIENSEGAVVTIMPHDTDWKKLDYGNKPKKQKKPSKSTKHKKNKI